MRADHRRANQRVLVFADNFHRRCFALANINAHDPALWRILVSAKPQPVADRANQLPVIVDAGDERAGLRIRLVERHECHGIARICARR